jgi:hypothetical protein
MGEGRNKRKGEGGSNFSHLIHVPLEPQVSRIRVRFCLASRTAPARFCARPARCGTAVSSETV